MKTRSGKIIPNPYDLEYVTSCRLPKWSVPTTPLQSGDPRCLQRIGAFRDWTKADHLDAAAAHAKAREGTATQYGQAVKSAMRDLGDKDPGPLTSGIVSDRFPRKAKKLLRYLAQSASEHNAASRLHWKAAGKRADYQSSPLHTHRPIVYWK